MDRFVGAGGRVPLPRWISREEIEAALHRDALRRRAERGELMALAAVTGIPPDVVYAEMLALCCGEACDPGMKSARPVAETERAVGGGALDGENAQSGHRETHNRQQHAVTPRSIDASDQRPDQGEKDVPRHTRHHRWWPM